MIAAKSHLLIVFLALMFVAGCTTRIEYPESAKIASLTPSSININTATAAELDKLPHIGRKTAETIVQFREENGPFRRIEQIMQIRGVSETRFIEIRQFLTTE